MSGTVRACSLPMPGAPARMRVGPLPDLQAIGAGVFVGGPVVVGPSPRGVVKVYDCTALETLYGARAAAVQAAIDQAQASGAYGEVSALLREQRLSAEAVDLYQELESGLLEALAAPGARIGDELLAVLLLILLEARISQALAG